jgi:hypothetical protein
MNGAGRRDGAEQARSLRALPVVAARIAKDVAKFNAALLDRAMTPLLPPFQPAAICPKIPAMSMRQSLCPLGRYPTGAIQ